MWPVPISWETWSRESYPFVCSFWPKCTSACLEYSPFCIKWFVKSQRICFHFRKFDGGLILGQDFWGGGYLIGVITVVLEQGVSALFICCHNMPLSLGETHPKVIPNDSQNSAAPSHGRRAALWPVSSPQVRGVKLIFTGGHISLTVAFKGPNIISGLYKCNYSLTGKWELGTVTG